MTDVTTPSGYSYLSGWFLFSALISSLTALTFAVRFGAVRMRSPREQTNEVRTSAPLSYVIETLAAMCDVAGRNPSRVSAGANRK